VSGDVVHDLTPAGGVSDVDCILEIQVRRDRRKIVGIVIHVVSVGGLSRASMAATIVRNDAISVTQKEHHLGIPIVGR